MMNKIKKLHKDSVFFFSKLYGKNLIDNFILIFLILWSAGLTFFGLYISAELLLFKLFFTTLIIVFLFAIIVSYYFLAVQGWKIFLDDFYYTPKARFISTILNEIIWIRQKIESKLFIFFSCFAIFYFVVFGGIFTLIGAYITYENFILYVISISYVQIFVAFTISFALIAYFIRFYRKAISFFIGQKYLVKSLIVYTPLAILFAIYVIIDINANFEIKLKFESFLSDFFIGTIAGLVVVSLTGVYMQKLFLQQRNDQKLDYAKAILHNKKSSDADVELAITMLGELDKDSHAESQYFFGTVYRDGMANIKENPKEAKKFFQKAAKHGHALSQFNLSAIYSENKYAPKSAKESFKWCLKAAQQNDSEAQARLASMYTIGLGTSKNHKKAAKWYSKAADSGHAVAQLNLGVLYAMGQGVPQNYEKAMGWYRKALKQDLSNVYYNIGENYYCGLGVPQDHKRASKWFGKAAEKGDSDAEYRLGTLHYKGWGVQQNYKKAEIFWLKAAEKGSTGAQYDLGLLYYEGSYAVHQDYRKARKWWGTAAIENIAMAQNSLGFLYYKGYAGVPQNKSKAKIWWAKASGKNGIRHTGAYANLHALKSKVYRIIELEYYIEEAKDGTSRAQYELGNMYYIGEGTPQNYREAEKWFRKAADQGDGVAQLTLGDMYKNGRGIRQSYKEAINLYRFIAKQGNPYGQSRLGELYYDGFPKSLIRAYMWTSLALSNNKGGFGDGLIKLTLDYIKSEMSRKDIRKAKKLVKRYKGATYEDWISSMRSI